jgi:signal transduction histidine kinase
MEDSLTRSSLGPSEDDERRRGRARKARDRDVETAPNHLTSTSPTTAKKREGPISWVRRNLPRGNLLDERSFQQRHLLLCWILGLHVPALFAFGVWRGYGIDHSALEVVVPAACLAFGRLARQRRLAAFFVTAGLVFCSSVLVHLSGGTVEAHFHFFILVGLIGLYQDWVPFLWNVVFTVLSHGVGSSIGSDLMFNHQAAQAKPWVWAVIHGVAVLAACLSVIVFWKNTEIEQERAIALSESLAEAQLASAQREATQRRSVSELFVNLARRNQSLLNRQLGLIAELEQRERQPEALAELFQLDHLATRIRRNAESLIVLSGAEPPRRWGQPVPLGEVVRAAAAEIEDYDRVEVLVNDHLEVTGRAVADLAHLLAELIENAAVFSPPASEVRVRSHLAEWSAYVLSIEDTGIGMPEADIEAANEVLADPPEVDMTRSTLGFHVVSRLAKRYNIRVRLASTPGGGITAMVTLPDDLVSERRRELQPPGEPTNWTMADSGTLRVPPQQPMSPQAPPSSPPALTPFSRPVTMDQPLHTNGWHEPPHTNGWHVTQPAMPATASPPPAPAPPIPQPAPAPAPSPMPQPQPAPAGSGTAGAAAPLTADGLVRRVPGAGLASLRNGAEPTPEPTPEPRPDHDREHMRSMLSRFQASQRAGRAAAASPSDAPRSQENP